MGVDCKGSTENFELALMLSWRYGPLTRKIFLRKCSSSLKIVTSCLTVDEPRNEQKPQQECNNPNCDCV